ncbi:16185_t:CDS:2 [Funneliformis geosporum]|uniref:GDP-fucose protein O-fucosyltransferase 2 n=1 Tax=Funneliformis geosporum TaxID=1117311 RepID=A0A9W4X0Y6_9GLOM|nr:9956_t:CDS:2 [Funneliformis geosporum]CAI2187308.1 16185_t:CDS:2 [Funneliformis geosporum]
MELNQKYCGSSQCKFLFLYKVMEQESKARKHFKQFVQIAQKLNRTLVLTNVGESRIGACFTYPFSYYYSTEFLQKNFPDLRVITQQQFSEWTRLRKQKPSSHQIFFQESHQDTSFGFVENEPILSKLKRDLCHEFIKFYFDTLKRFDDAEILLMDQKFHHEFFLKRVPDLEYAPHIIEKALEIIRNLQPFIAAQWRMELGNPLNMPRCAEKLVSHVESLKVIYNTRNVYLATDYPLKDSLAQSFTFHNVKIEYHGKAMDILRDKIGFLSWLNYTLTDQFGNEMDVKDFASSGIPGILDKIVCSRAKIFLTAPPECRKRSSSYTSMITGERLALMKNGIKEIENINLEW